MEQPDAWRMTGRLEHELGRGDPFAAAIRATRMPMIITDPRQGDNPIVFANDAFLALTGYGRDEIMGRNCRFLQGPKTDPAVVEAIGEALRARRDINVDLLNYRKDGSAFWNALYISPVFASAGDVQYYFASQLDVTERQDELAAKTALLHEVDHRVKNNLQMVTALITMQADVIADPELRRSLTTTMRRVEALATVHRRLYQSEDVTRFSVGDFVEDIMTDLIGATGREDIAVRLDLDAVTVPAENAAPIALIVNELVTNALKHAYAGGRGGTLAVRVEAAGERFRIGVEDDGPGLPPEGGIGPSSFGLNLVRMLGRQLRASITWAAAVPTGTRVLIDLPVEQLTPGG